MEAAACGSALQFSTWIGSEKKGRRRNSFVGFNHRCRKEYSFEVINLDELQLKSVSNGRRRIHMGIPHSCKGSKAPTLESGNCCTSFDGRWFLKKKAEEVASCLDGRCIFLVGMMGSGKTTVGKVLSEALDYAFVDSDSFVEQAVGGTSVAQIFNQCGESFFRDYESEALRKLSLMPQQVVATGGGAVVRPVNWKYMKQGISVFIECTSGCLGKENCCCRN
ncbi:hypothetical protein L1049_025619 [Liquidambar formosana]|uniref:shikimate kinase n=1 Tax=Liquidambar formosana TaxID=63359 RepID=A0AAP0R8K0_LIQFO